MRTRGFFLIGIFSVLLLAATAPDGHAQKQQEGAPPKTTTTHNKAKHKKQEKKQPLELYRSSSNWILYGNKCASDFTKKYGFRYVIISGNRNRNLGEAFHNFFTNIHLTLKNGPFWKIRLKKQLKQCRSKTADEMG